MSSSLLSPPQPTRPSFFRSISSSSSKSLTQTVTPRRDKPRLYLALYDRGGSNISSSYASSVTCDSYHWTILVGPQAADRTNPGTCYQIVHTNSSTGSNAIQSSSLYDETDLSQQSTAQSQALLARITIAKVLDENRLRSLLRSISLPSELPSKQCGQSDSGYDTDDFHVQSTCLAWVKEAYKVLTADVKCLRGYIEPEDWAEVEEVTRLYARKKRRQGRFGGQRIADAWRHWNPDEIATWNFWENRESTP